jgi:hypothetical protein
MPDLIRYRSSPVTVREQRGVARELAAVRRPARTAQARICANAQTTAVAMQSLATLSRLEIQLSGGDEITAQRLGLIMHAATSGMVYQIGRLWIEG